MLDDLLLVLQPVEQYFIWDIFAYVIFALALIGIIVSGDDDASIAGFFAFILVGAVMDKTYALGWILEPETSTLQMRIDTHQSVFWVMLVRALMFALSMMGIMTSKKKAPRALFVLLTILTLIYALGRWWATDGQAFVDSRTIYLPFFWV